MTLTSVPIGRPSTKPIAQTQKVIEPSHDLRPDGLIAIIPWIMVWNKARHWAIPNMIMVK